MSDDGGESHERILTAEQWYAEQDEIKVLREAVLDMWEHMDARDSVYLQSDTIRIANHLRHEETAEDGPGGFLMQLSLPSG